MPLLSFSVKHGQTRDLARANFERGIGEASATFAMGIKSVEWSPDRTSAKLIGPGFEVTMWVDAEHVHATGDIPVFAKLFEAPLKSFLEQTFHKPLPPRQ
jgi:hypothetical protein